MALNLNLPPKKTLEICGGCRGEPQTRKLDLRVIAWWQIPQVSGVMDAQEIALDGDGDMRRRKLLVPSVPLSPWARPGLVLQSSSREAIYVP